MKKTEEELKTKYMSIFWYNFQQTNTQNDFLK